MSASPISPRLALLADVHGNLEALEAVLDDLDRVAPDATVVCAGDIVGYGPDPWACIDRLRARDALCVIGNHEEMLLGRRDFSQCVYAGIRSALWARQRMPNGAQAFLEALPLSREVAPGVVVCHGDLTDTQTYVSEPERGADALAQLRTGWPQARLLICGHTHHPMVYSETTGFRRLQPPLTLELGDDSPAVVNPGAVGQSRNGRAVARYALLDRRDGWRIEFRELQYDHAATLRKMKQERLVPQVVMTPPATAMQRAVERWKCRWLRWRSG